MKMLEPPDIHYLRAARGWLGLDDWISASEALEQIRPDLQSHPLVLITRSDILLDAKKWDALLQFAKSVLLVLVPDGPEGVLDGSWALYQMKRTQEAYDFLLPGARKFPSELLIPCNLAAYSAVLGRHKEAWQWLERAFELDFNRAKQIALADSDLAPFWADIAALTGWGTVRN